MELLDWLAKASFYGLLGGILVTAVLTVTVRNLFHAAIFLAFSLIGVACVYFFLRADFLAGVQILLYVGAILTLIIFAIMLTSKMADPKVPQTNRQRYPTLVLLAAFAYFLIPAVLKASWKTTAQIQTADAIKLGKALMGEFVFPFEVISLVLLIALIGAIVIARSDQ